MHFCRAVKDLSLEKLSLITLFLLQIRTRSSTSLYRSIQKTWRTSAGFWPQLVCQQTKLSSSLLLLFTSQPGSKSVFSKVILPGRHFISSLVLPQLSHKDHEHLVAVSSRMFSQSPQLCYGTVRSGLCPCSRSVRFRRSRSLDAHAERRTSECTSLRHVEVKTTVLWKQITLFYKHLVLFINSPGLHGLPVWWAAPLGEGKPVRVPAAVDFTRTSPGSPALHPALLGRCGCKEPRKQPPLQPVRLIPQLWYWSVKTCTTKIVFIGDGFECKQRTLKTLQDSYTYSLV